MKTMSIVASCFLVVFCIANAGGQAEFCEGMQFDSIDITSAQSIDIGSFVAQQRYGGVSPSILVNTGGNEWNNNPGVPDGGFFDGFPMAKNPGIPRTDPLALLIQIADLEKAKRTLLEENEKLQRQVNALQIEMQSITTNVHYMSGKADMMLQWNMDYYSNCVSSVLTLISSNTNSRAEFASLTAYKIQLVAEALDAKAP